MQSLASAVAVGLDDRGAHVVGEVRRVQPLEESEPALREIDQALAAHFAPFVTSRPRRAARIKASSRFTSPLATRLPASVMR